MEMKVEKKTLVSVATITYNQELYIAQTIESVLMQVCNFDFEILIGEDCSTDGTLRICQEYADKYPCKIKLFAREKNLGLLDNYFDILEKCQGKYVAPCAGDDYWIDEYKLQKQVDFLEANPDYALVHTNFKQFIQKKNKLNDVVFKRDTGHVFQNLLKSNQIGALTVLVRRNILLEGINQDFSKKFLMEDYPLWLYMAQSYKIGYLDDVTAVYRVLPESVANTQNKIKTAIFNNSVLEIKVFFAEKNNCIDLILDNLIKSYKRQLCLGLIYWQKDLFIKAYTFLEKYKYKGHKIYFICDITKYILYHLAKRSFKIIFSYK